MQKTKNIIQRVKIDQLIPADYNPRYLSQDAFEMLKNSLSELGQIKPILVKSETNIIIAGHQRTRAMKALGWEECDAIVISGLSDQDEARFNQFHNRTEYELSDNAPSVHIQGPLIMGLQYVNPKNIIIDDKGTSANINHILSTLLQKYGTFGMPIATPDGSVKISSAYALVSKLCRDTMPLLVISEEKMERAIEYLSKQYGEFNYDNIKRTTYVQALAQMHRLKGQGARKIRSKTYERLVKPFLRDLGDNGKNLKMIDFGAGHYTYALQLQEEGYNIDMIDPYHRYQTGDQRTGRIAVKENKEKFTSIAHSIRDGGLYDVVICDSVLNSIDTIQAWHDVVNVCHALLKRGGILFISGRTTADISCKSSNISATNRLTEYFTDKNNLTAQFRQGKWFFQKFDTKEEINYIVQQIGEKITLQTDNCYRAAIRKTKDIDLDNAIQSLRREWDLQLPNGMSYGLSDIIEDSYRKAIENEVSRVQNKEEV